MTALFSANITTGFCLPVLLHNAVPMLFDISCNSSHVIAHDYGTPSVAVDRQNATGGNGQLRTRVQAFVESLEIKQLQAQRGGK